MFWNLEIPPYRILPPVLFLVLSFCRISKFVVSLEFVFLFYFILTLQRLLRLQLYCCFINEYIYKYVYGVKFSPLSSFFVYLFTQFLSFFFQPKKNDLPFSYEHWFWTFKQWNLWFFWGSIQFVWLPFFSGKIWRFLLYLSLYIFPLSYQYYQDNIYPWSCCWNGLFSMWMILLNIAVICYVLRYCREVPFHKMLKFLGFTIVSGSFGIINSYFFFVSRTTWRNYFLFVSFPY